ncbi:hypothetical protein SLEP1_g6003 [Rubroshorea leprosula]|uniref:PIN-like protein n=1 Tax=Rubroshorea leprosula TaxID=152421 RepID=A0AAV5I1X0_9ROSI|nr:hypothetical protein SLEP1_g6003 [Rubroshorea leprosula]
MDFLDLFILALMPVLKVLLVTAVGLFLAMDRVNLLGPDARSHLNNSCTHIQRPSRCGYYGKFEKLVVYASEHPSHTNIGFFAWMDSRKNHKNSSTSARSCHWWLFCREYRKPAPGRSSGTLWSQIVHLEILPPALQMQRLMPPFLLRCEGNGIDRDEHPDPIVGFTIGLVSPIRKLLIGDSAPLRTIYSSAALIGNAAIPCITLIIGANLLKGLRRYGVGAPIIAGIAAIKFIILPALVLALLKLQTILG